MYSVIELFSGAGGLALGLELSGFTPLCLIEKDLISCNTLKKNRPNWMIISKDIHDINPQLFKTIFKLLGIRFISRRNTMSSF